MGDVSCEAGSCKTTEDTSSCGSDGCGCCSGDPMESAAKMWTCSFFEAMKQAQVELLKSKIQKAWGDKMGKAADAVVESMGVQWQAMLSQAQAKADVETRLRQLWSEGRK